MVALNFALERCYPLILWLKAFLTGTQSQPEAAPNIKCPFAKSGAPNPHKPFTKDGDDSDTFAAGENGDESPLLSDSAKGNKSCQNSDEIVPLSSASSDEKSVHNSPDVSQEGASPPHIVSKSSAKGVAKSTDGEASVPQSGDEGAAESAQPGAEACKT